MSEAQMRRIGYLRSIVKDRDAEIERLRTRVRELEGQHKGLVLNNAILRERPDLPLNRIPAARAMTKLYEENERLRAALEQLLACPAIADGNHGDPAWACHETAAAETFARKVLARAALDGQPAPGKEEV